MSERKKEISGFSKMAKRDKIYWIAKNFLYENPIDLFKEFAGYWHDNVEAQKLLDGFSENTLTNFPMPFGVAPNFLINGETYAVPMVTEESSVVAAASNAAKFWQSRGGFQAKVISTVKVGQIHLQYSGDGNKLYSFFEEQRQQLKKDIQDITTNMEARGGGVTGMELINFTDQLPGFYQIRVYFETVDSMGANFINSCLEALGQSFTDRLRANERFTPEEKSIEIIMCILSNYTPDCVVQAKVSCPVSELGKVDELSAEDFAQKFVRAVDIACTDSYRATTHNKGIMNGIDAVVIATGNDFRAVESCAHTYAARSGVYRSLSTASIINNQFEFELTIPLAVGTVGGLTKLHPLARRSMELLGNPSAKKLMEIIACVGLAQNFAAVKSLTTTGIQAGHMKMHLTNILASFQSSDAEADLAKTHFADKTISVAAVREFLEQIRTNPQ